LLFVLEFLFVEGVLLSVEVEQVLIHFSIDLSLNGLLNYWLLDEVLDLLLSSLGNSDLSNLRLEFC